MAESWSGPLGPRMPPSHRDPLPPRRPPRRVSPLSYTPPHLTEKILDARQNLEGERKQVTVLFADIKDSTELIRDLDPEAAQQLLDPALHHMMDAVHRYEGTVNQVLGDGIMALFGAPIAHEDHALRACYAALAMQAAMRDYTEEVRRAHGLELRIRVGLNSGEVVVRAIGNDLHMDYSAVGQTTHLAARMEQLATPGSIRQTAATLRLVEGLVQVNALGPIPVKGLTEPVEVFELVGASAVRRRLQAAVARGLTRFVGRETEIAALVQALARAGAGHGQVVAAVGEAGVGKSRLMYEFVHSHRTQGWLVLEAASVSYGKATPYFPVVDLLKRYMHVEDGDEPRTVRAKVTGHLLTLGRGAPGDHPGAAGAPGGVARRQPLSEARSTPAAATHPRRAQARAAARKPGAAPAPGLRRPALDRLRDPGAARQSRREPADGPLLLLVNYRPEYQHGWGSKTYYTQLRLDPLPPASADELLQALLGDDPSLAPLKQLLIARTEGNPFFLEESVRTLVETGVLVGEPGAYRLAQTPRQPAGARHGAGGAGGAHRPPATGGEAPPPDGRGHRDGGALAAVQAIAELPEAALHRGLAHLQAAEFLYETRLFPEHEYTFKHALTHEVAYGSLLLGAAAGAACAHCRGPGGARRGPGGRAGRTPGAPCPAGRGVGQGPGVLPAGRGEGHGAVGPPRGRGVLRAGAQCPAASAGDARHTRAGHRSPARPALGALSVWRLWAYPGVSARGRGPRGGPRRPASAGTGLSLSVQPFPLMGAYDQAIAAAQRALALATAGGEVVLHALANQLPRQ